VRALERVTHVPARVDPMMKPLHVDRSWRTMELGGVKRMMERPPEVRYWEIHGLDQEEDKKIGPAAKKPSTVEQRVDRTPKEGKARETSSLIKASKET
jgi:hypothetical protein